ncbi:MAG: PD-(D/E)XK nuclease family protein, partial [Planctomycetota bacterium]
MVLKYDKYEYTPVLGWSASRYETFDKCSRMYYYHYYGKYVTDVPPYKMRQLKELTSVPLEIGHVVHDVMEAFLRRLQKDVSNIDERRFFHYAREQTRKYFSRKTFLEMYYHQLSSLDIDAAHERIGTCLQNFIDSPV